MNTKNPYEDGTREHHAWRRGYEGLVFLSDDDSVNNIYDVARRLAVVDCLHSASTEVVKEVVGGHLYFVLKVNGMEVHKAMLEQVVLTLQEKLDKALTLS